ncbi:hypothetical protein SAMN05444372_102139 [Flavobacterium micromati]|uniref:Uncharacterized protein n=1 Tax=Flavobacterium micromati TaxID=229205 RepID=A0A1M5GT05_9FLAO|nr:hypothetical protein [Flavobacterium micromati]SHG06849.1 hypothetical protein SAMN05444372_102139 [Flavobacterium micromati]
MKKNTLAEISNEELLKKRDLMKGVTIGFSIIYLFVLAFILYLVLTRGFKNISPVVLFTPVFICTITLMPFLIYFGMLKKEMKSRQL